MAAPCSFRRSREQEAVARGLSGTRARGKSVEPVPRPFGRPLCLRRIACLYFVRSDAAVAVLVIAQDERARLFHELLARDLAILVFVEVAEIRFRQRAAGLVSTGDFGHVAITH